MHKGDSLPDGFRFGKLKHSESHKIKISNALKNYVKTTEHCANLSKSHLTDSYKTKITQTCLERYGVKNPFQADFVKEKCNTPEAVEKRFNTMKQNGTIGNKSKAEDLFYRALCDKYGYDNVERQYKDERYPFACDFYIKSEDKFIEFNKHWTHGEMPFNLTNQECITKLNKWKERSKTSKYFETAIDVWTNRDVKKLEIAKLNNLNYEVIY